MKRLSLLLALTPLLALGAEPAPTRVDTLEDLRPLAAQAPVAAIDFTLPDEKPAKALWDRFANKPEEKQFAIVTARDWKAKWKLLVEVLVAKAEQQKVDGAELRSCLAVLNMGLTEETGPVPMMSVGVTEITAVIRAPDGTIQTRTSPSTFPPQEPVSAASQAEDEIGHGEPPDTGIDATIPVGAYLARHKGGPCWIVVCKWESASPELTLGHIRIWAVDCATHKIIGFTGCD